MKDSTPSGVNGFLESIASRLNSTYLLVLMVALFALDMVVPDPIFLIDEIMLGLITILVARWRSREKAKEAASEAGASTKPPPKDVTPNPPSGW